MLDSVLSLFTEVTLDGFPLWVVLLICAGVFLASFMDAIAGGGGIISVPVYLMAFSGLPTYYVLGTNKLSAGIGTISPPGASSHGYVHWRVFLPAAGLAVLGSVCGTQLQLRTPDVVLKYLLWRVLRWCLLHPADQDLAGGAGPHLPPAAGPDRLDRRPGHRCLRRVLRPRHRHVPDADLHPSGQHGHPPRRRRRQDHQPGLQPGESCAPPCWPGPWWWAWVWCPPRPPSWGTIWGRGLAIKNGSRIVRPTVILVLVLLLVKVVSSCCSRSSGADPAAGKGLRRWRRPFFSSLPLQDLLQVLACEAGRTGGHFLRRPRDNHRAAAVAPLGAQVDEVVGALDDVQVVLDDHGVAAFTSRWRTSSSLRTSSVWRRVVGSSRI